MAISIHTTGRKLTDSQWPTDHKVVTVYTVKHGLVRHSAVVDVPPTGLSVVISWHDYMIMAAGVRTILCHECALLVRSSSYPETARAPEKDRLFRQDCSLRLNFR